MTEGIFGWPPPLATSGLWLLAPAWLPWKFSKPNHCYTSLKYILKIQFPFKFEISFICCEKVTINFFSERERERERERNLILMEKILNKLFECQTFTPLVNDSEKSDQVSIGTDGTDCAEEEASNEIVDSLLEVPLSEVTADGGHHRRKVNSHVRHHLFPINGHRFVCAQQMAVLFVQKTIFFYRTTRINVCSGTDAQIS